MSELALLQQAAQEALPRSAEAWAFLGVVFTAACAAVGAVFKYWATKRDAAAKVKLDGAQQEIKEATATAARLAATQDRLIESAERREKEATARTDAAIAGMALLTTSVTDLVASNRALASEVQRANTNVEYILRERK